MKILFLGTGTSTGVPEIGCNCAVCTSTDTKDKRLRSSILIQSANETVLIDAGPDFRQQMLAHHITHLNAVLLTHEHYDHIAGMDDLRPFGSVGIYAQKRVLDVIQKNMAYAFIKRVMPLNVPRLVLHEVGNKPFSIGSLTFEPIQLMHYRLPILGFRTGKFAYLTDFGDIPETEYAKLQNLDVLVLDALRIKGHPSHNSLEQALEYIEKIKPRKAYLTHVSHGMGLHAEVQPQLPDNVLLAYDGMEIMVK